MRLWCGTALAKDTWHWGIQYNIDGDSITVWTYIYNYNFEHASDLVAFKLKFGV